MRKLKSKTLGWAAILGIVALILSLPQVQAIVPIQAVPYFLAFSAIVTAVLRAVTIKPLGS